MKRDQIQNACSYKLKGSSRFVKPEWLPEHNAGKDYSPSHNIAPTDVTPVLVSSCKYDNATCEKQGRVLKPMLWGVIPPWHKVNNVTLKLIRIKELISNQIRRVGSVQCEVV